MEKFKEENRKVSCMLNSNISNLHTKQQAIYTDANGYLF